VLAGGVALASAAFAVGSQSGDGSAVAARDGGATQADNVRLAPFGAPPPGGDVRMVHRGGPGHGPDAGLSSLADDLGVTEEQLRDAFDALRPSGDPGDELAAALAQSLGVDRAKVEEALEGLRTRHGQDHEQRHGEFAAALAEELGISAENVREAFEAAKPDGDRRGRRHGPRAMLGALATELGVSRAELRAALAAVRPDGPPPGGPGGPGHRGGPGGDLAADLADALGVEEDAVEQALEDFHDSRHDEFAQKLADELGIDVDKVTEALPERP
jgi:biotin operon repressor